MLGDGGKVYEMVYLLDNLQIQEEMPNLGVGLWKWNQGVTANEYTAPVKLVFTGRGMRCSKRLLYPEDKDYPTDFFLLDRIEKAKNEKIEGEMDHITTLEINDY